MSEMIDAVAKAICEADNHGWPGDDYNGRTQRRFYERQARAAIAAMREMTPAMKRLDASLAEGWSPGIVPPMRYAPLNSHTGASWEQLIDEALK